MLLTDTERKMLSGACGEGVRTAMETVVRMGERYGAERLLPVSRAHIDAAAYTTVWDAGSDFVEYLAEHGATCAVPTSINPISRDMEHWAAHGTTAAFAAKSERLERAYLKMGVKPSWTCAPYQGVNVPAFGEIVSWSESNAVCYVNSVLGARAERLPDLMDVCCAMTGRVPAYGRYLDENRRGELLFTLQGFDADAFCEPSLAALLGYYVGEIAVSRVPVITGLPGRITADALKALCAAAASGGAVSLFHLVGVTPEAPDVQTAFGLRAEAAIPADVPRYTVTPADLSALQVRLNTVNGRHADLVVLGCPHASAEELHRIAALLAGRAVAAGTELWIMTDRANAAAAAQSCDLAVLEAAGARITRDTCLMEMDEGDGRFFGKNMITNSGKAVQYAPAICGVKGMIADLAACVDAAVTGQLPTIANDADSSRDAAIKEEETDRIGTAGSAEERCLAESAPAAGPASGNALAGDSPAEPAVIRTLGTVVPGSVCAPALVCDTPLSFWGGVDVKTGRIIDVHHPACGETLTGKILCIPFDRGSCSGSGVMLEMLRLGTAPAGLLCIEAEPVLALAPLIGERLYKKTLPVRTVAKEDYSRLAGCGQIRFAEDGIILE